jgi:hypothetical protein
MPMKRQREIMAPVWPRLLSWWRAVCSLSFWTGGAAGPITAGSESICANSCVARARKADAAGVGSPKARAGPLRGKNHCRAPSRLLRLAPRRPFPTATISPQPGRQRRIFFGKQAPVQPPTPRSAPPRRFPRPVRRAFCLPPIPVRVRRSDREDHLLHQLHQCRMSAAPGLFRRVVAKIRGR